MPTKARSKLSQPGDARPLHNGGADRFTGNGASARGRARSFLSFTAFRNNFRETPRYQQLHRLMDGGCLVAL